MVDRRLKSTGFIIITLFILISCNKSSYPCPDHGGSGNGDLSSAEGAGKQKKKYSKSGLVNKKNPKRLSR